MSLDPTSGRRSVSPASSGRSSPVPRAERRAVEDELYRADKGLRRFGALIDRAVNSWDTAPQEWADYIAFLARLHKAIQSHPKDAPTLPHTEAVAYRLAQCLNPALPSGVHQKALEVYTYIFDTFGTGHLASHLSDYLPGLAPVLAYASLSVRPELYALFKRYIVKLPPPDLRPATKALILSLLPALEEETGEDFGEALTILQNVEQALNDGTETEPQDGFFWQTMFLCIVSAPSRRHGSLNYLTRRLPRFVSTVKQLSKSSADATANGSGLDHLTQAAKAAIFPEAGLLVRCFVAGLSDANPLVQRGFLELLVTHLPLSSPVLLQGVDANDRDRLVSATLNVLLRRDVSLNRRVWAWLLGPEPTNPSSPTAERTSKVGASKSLQTQHFELLARAPLLRCLFAVLAANDAVPATRSRPYRICLSLMDRWEIGSSVLPDVFLPAMESFRLYSKAAQPSTVSEVQRSVSMFFDGVEAGLIWSTFASMIQDAIGPTDPALGTLDSLLWMLKTFNVREEEMITVHAPLVALLLLGRLCMLDSNLDDGDYPIVLSVASTLVDLMPARAFAITAQDTRVFTDMAGTSEAYVKAVAQFYERERQSSSSQSPPFTGPVIGQQLLQYTITLTLRALRSSVGHLFQNYLDLLVAVLAKVPEMNVEGMTQLLDAITEALETCNARDEGITLSSLNSLLNFLLNATEHRLISEESVLQLTPGLSRHLWCYLSPNTPKYHVEAVKLLWQLEALTTQDRTLEAALLDFLRPLQETAQNTHALVHSREEAIRRFAVLWNHSVPSQAWHGTLGPSKRGTSLPNPSDLAQVGHRIQTLAKSLFRIIDLLREPSSPAAEVAKRWLGGLQSLDVVLAKLLERFYRLVKELDGEVAEAERRLRDSKEKVRELAYLLTLLQSVLSNGTEWTWECFAALENDAIDIGQQSSMALLTQGCIRLLANRRELAKQLHEGTVALLQVLFDGPAGMEIKGTRVDELLLDRMVVCLQDEDAGLQSPLLRLITSAIRLRVSELPRDSSEEAERRYSLSSRRQSTPAHTHTKRDLANSNIVSPPPQLVKTIRVAFASKSARLYTEQWVAFLLTILPTFASAIFAGLLPLVETLCSQLKLLAGELEGLTTVHGSSSSYAPDTGMLCLLEALEATLARAHECLTLDYETGEPSSAQAQTTGFLNSVASGVFKVQGPPSRTSRANSRLTLILAFHDSVRCCLDLWTWSNNVTALDGYDKTSAATTAYAALRLRNKTRYLLEQMFATEPLESLEALMNRWRTETQTERCTAMMSLFQVMQGSRPKHIIPAILDSLCSRIIPSALPPARQSSQTTDLTGDDVTLFLLAYLRSTEDDAMDEVSADCITFAKDVLANPLPYRHHMPAMLALVHLLSRKIANTKFGEQKKLRRELADIFQKLLAATFSTMSSGFFAEAPRDDIRSGTDNIRPLSVLQSAVDDIETILDSQDRIATVMVSITNNVLAPVIHSKAFPSSLSPGHLDLLLSVAKKTPTAKAWKKDVADAFNDPKLFAAPLDTLQARWLPIFYQWTVGDKDRMSEFLSRITAPTTAGIMFGVGANAARLEADRKTQLNLRRVCLLLLASPEDTWVSFLRDFDEKLVELFGATTSSSPSSAVKADLFMLCRTLVLSLSAVHLAPLWPTVNNSLQAALKSLLIGQQKQYAFSNLSLLQACKLLDQLVMLSPDEFQLHEWLYIADTVDAVYQHAEHETLALADQVAETLGYKGVNDVRTLVTPTTSNGEATDRRRLLLRDTTVEIDDIKAMERDEFAATVMRPFLSQLSIHAYEGTYSMEAPDIEACRRNLLEDLTDLATVVA